MTQRERGWHRVTPEAEDAKSGWEGQGFLFMAEKGVTIELGFQGLLVAPHKKVFSPLCLGSHRCIGTDSHYPVCIANITGPRRW